MRAARALELERLQGGGMSTLARAHEAVARLEVEMAQARAERSERAELQAELRRRADTKVARVALSEQMRLRNAHAAVERAALYPNHGGYARGGTPPRTAPLPTRSTPALGPRTALGPSTPPTSARGATGVISSHPMRGSTEVGREPCFDHDSPYGAPRGSGWPAAGGPIPR